MTAPATQLALRRIARPLQARAAAGWLALAIGASALLLGAAAWAVRIGRVEAPYWVLVAWALALAALCLTAVPAWRRRPSAASVADSLERSGEWRNGSLTTLLDHSAEGTSPALLELADRSHAAELARRGSVAAAPLARGVRSVAVAGFGVLALGLLAFASAGPVHGSAAALWHPRRAWEATVAPVRLRAASIVVDRGDSVALEVQAIGRRSATLWLRAPGESWRSRPVALDSLGHARVSSGPLQSDIFALATSGRRGSDTLVVRVRLPVFLGSLTVTAHYPAYLGLDSEPIPTGGDTLLLPAGTRLETRGEATAPLVEARWASSASRRAAQLTVHGSAFSGSFVPRQSGEYRLDLATAGGAPLTSDTVRLAVRLVADSVPRVDLPLPGRDTVAPLSLSVPVVVDARDDHGLTAVAIESRRISRLGNADAVRREALPLRGRTTDRAILSYTLDLSHRGLLPGDTVRYAAVAVDNSPARQEGRSREYVLRLPTTSEVRSAAREATDQVAGRLDSLTSASRQLERETDDLARTRPRDNDNRGDRRGEPLSFEESKRAEAVARSQQELMRQAESLTRSLEALRRSAEAAGINDTAWQRQLGEIRAELERALSPELRDRLLELQQSLKELDPERARGALERLAEAQRQMREALERSRELFKRAAQEGDLANLGQESRELVREQHAWNDQVALEDSTRSAEAERQLAARADSLASALTRLAASVDDSARAGRFDDAADRARRAGRQMQQAAASSLQGQRSRARQEGEEAEQSLAPLGDQLQQEREGMRQAWRNEVLAEIDQALAETSRLAERQLAVQQQLQSGGQPGAQLRAEQGAIEEGVQRVAEQVRRAAGKNALIPADIGTALGSAQQQMQQAREAIGSAMPNAREGAEQAGGAVDALNAAAHQLLRARGDVAGAASGTGLAEAIERMAQLAQQQGGLGQQGAGLLPLAGTAAIREQLRQLGARQQALAEELQKLKAGGQIPGAGELGDEAEELARRLDAGRLDRQVVERQERLFRRMLDAGRTLQGREEDPQKERQSTTATDDSVHLPPALRARLSDETGRLRVPSWDELQQLSPEDRRLVVDYFRRLTEQGAP